MGVLIRKQDELCECALCDTRKEGDLSDADFYQFGITKSMTSDFQLAEDYALHTHRMHEMTERSNIEEPKCTALSIS